MVNLAAFDLNLLRVLDALLTEGSTVKAAAKLGLTQPAVSAALGRLRGTLGDELFLRRGQGLEPTDYALSIAPELRTTLVGIEQMLDGYHAFDPTTSDARFRVSGSDFFAELLMPRLAERLSRLAPSMLVHLVDLVPDYYIHTIEAHDVDLVLIPETDVPPWIGTQYVFSSSFSVIARRGHPRLGRAGIKPGETVPLDLFCDIGHVLFSTEGAARGLGDKALAAVGRERRVVMTMPVFSGVYRAVAGSDLIALMPTQFANAVADAGRVEVYRPPMPVPQAKLTMNWHKRLSNRPSHRWFREQVADILGDLHMDKNT